MPTNPLLPCLALLLGACAAPGGEPPAGVAPGDAMSAPGDRPAAPEPVANDLPADAALPELLAHARRVNPGLRAAQERWLEAREAVPLASKLPEPRLRLAGYAREVETRTGPMRARVGISQRFPWFGELAHAGDQATERARAVRAELDTVRLELDHRVRTNWYEYAWLAQAIAIAEGHQDLLEHWESVARARLETGLSSHSDVIRAQVELVKLQDRLRSLEDLRRPVAAALNAALHRPPDATLPTPPEHLPPPQTFDEEVLRTGLEGASPGLRALEHRIEEARHGVELADTAGNPDFELGVDYTAIGSAVAPGTPDSGEDAWALTLGLDLPLWRATYGAGRRGARARERAARLEHEEALQRLGAELESALFAFRDAHRRVQLFRDSLVPKGEEAVRALDTAYQSGDEGFLDLIDSQRVLLDFQLQAARAEADRAVALARMERLTGIPLHDDEVTQ